MAILTNVAELTLRTFPVNQSHSNITIDVYSLSPGALVELFELDATSLGDSIYRFHDGKNEFKNDVVWTNETYSAFPIEVDGFEQSTGGTLPKPTLKVANIDGAIGALNRSFSDLVGAKLTRKRTMVKYLDSINFIDGNPLEDTSQSFPDDVFYINRKMSEDRVFVVYELAAAIDVQGIKLPRRQFIQNVCTWEYRSKECSYAGDAVADVLDVPTTDLDADVCSKKITGCKLRFGEYGILTYGGFPGTGLF